MAIVLAVLVVVRALASPATTPAVAGSYVNDAKIINFHMIPGIISCDEHIGPFGSGTLGRIVVIRDNVTMEM